MTKSKKANSHRTRATRGGHLPAPPKEAGTARKGSSSQPVEQPSIASTSPVLSLALEAECLVSGASILKDSLAGLLDEPLPITLDMTAVQRIDTAGLQVLTAFIRERAGHGRAVEWRGAAPVLTAAAQLLGLTSLLRLPA